MGGVHHKWKPIEDLPADWESFRRPNLHALAEVWKDYAQRMKDSPVLKDFLVKLKRQWAIETGQIERLYDLDRGVTQTLVEQGLHASLIPSSASEKSPEYVAHLLNDHHEIVDGLFQGVTGDRPISTSYIKQLHQVLMKHQDTIQASIGMDRTVEAQVLKGDWKKLPNSPTRLDDQVHEYCPPEHVASEMDRLVAMHQKHCEMGVPPEIEAAWLHHRFVQIHPFQDGNGRMARILATIVFLRAFWLPLTVNRDDWYTYIDSLEAADQGSLARLVKFFAVCQQNLFLKTCSGSEQFMPTAVPIEEILKGIRDQDRQQAHSKIQVETVDVAEDLCLSIHDLLVELKQEVEKVTGKLVKIADTRLNQMQPLDLRGYLIADLSHTADLAKQMGYPISLIKYGRWLSFCIYDSQPYEITFCLHGIGHNDLGLIAILPFVVRQDRRRTDSVVSSPPFQLDAELRVVTRVLTEGGKKEVLEWIRECSRIGIEFWSKHR